jgi:hypothetical protein
MKSTPLSDDEMEALRAVDERCPDSALCPMSRLQRGLWHLLSIPDLSDLHADPALRDVITRIVAARTSIGELTEALRHRDHQVRLMAMIMLEKLHREGAIEMS